MAGDPRPPSTTWRIANGRSHRVTAGETRVPAARLIVGAVAAVAGVAILLLTRRFNFYFDEWDFILAAPNWSFASYLQPHNEHPVMIPRLIHALLLNTFGLLTFRPSMAVLLLLHGVNVVLLFELVRRRSGDVIGLGAAALLLLLGAGWENLLWAFQMTFVGSVACGLGALLMLERPRSRASLGAAAGLTTASVMFSGIGLFFLVAAGVYLAVQKERWRDLSWLAPVAVAIGGWYLMFGRGAAIFCVLLLSDAARDVPWRGTWRPALIACLFLVCFNSAALLFEFGAAKSFQMQREGADLQALDAARNDPCLKPAGSPDPLVMAQITSPRLYYRAVDLYGDPAPPLPVTDAADYAAALANMYRTGFR